MINPNFLLNIKSTLQWWKLRKKLKSIKVLVLDVDGVLTDGGLFYNSKGEISKRFNVKDGLGIRLLQNTGIEVVFLSGGKGDATESRAIDLGITHCIVNAKDKPEAIEELCNKTGIFPNRILFVGDDLNDLALKNKVALLIATFDAMPSLKKNADAILNKNGGEGAVREIAERLLKAQGSWKEINNKGWRDRND